MGHLLLGDAMTFRPPPPHRFEHTGHSGLDSVPSEFLEGPKSVNLGSAH